MGFCLIPKLFGFLSTLFGVSVLESTWPCSYPKFCFFPLSQEIEMYRKKKKEKKTPASQKKKKKASGKYWVFSEYCK